jgi:hypothetical protein
VGNHHYQLAFRHPAPAPYKEVQMALPKDVTVVEDKLVTNFEKRSPGVPVVQDDTPNAAIMLALQKGTDPAIIEKLMDLAERQEANIARKAHFHNFAEFKKNMPTVIKDGKNANNKPYPTLGNLMGTVNPVAGEYGLSVNFRISDSEDFAFMTVTAVLSHELGHSEESAMTMEIETTGPQGKQVMTKTHARMSALTYLMRGTYSAVMGVAAIDKKFDDDGGKGASNKEEPKFITEKQVKEITKRIKEIYGDDPSMFFTWIEAETVDTITDYAKAKKGLDGAEKAKAAKDAADKDESRLGE